MSTIHGIFVSVNPDGSAESSKVKQYQSYNEMVNDTEPGKYGIIDNVVYHRNDGVWTIGFPNTTNETDYSAFEVMPNKIQISAGDVDDVTGETYSVTVPACTVHKMTLRSAQEPEECDVVIDWGDGTVEAIKNMTWTTTTHTVGKSYELTHDYASAMTQSSQRFIVKIYGKDYYTFRHNLYEDNNLISRIFDKDLPIASHLVNLASMAFSATRLLKVHFPSYTAPFSNVWNWTSCFEHCANVLSITGFEDMSIRDSASLSGFMASCGSLVTTDFIFPAGLSRIQNIFSGDTNLERDINDFFPKQGFSSANIMIRAPFGFCRKITGTVPADKLWNNPNIVWTFEHTTDRPFGYCSDELRAQVPVSWGGTASDDIIEKSLETRIADLESKLS